MPGFPIRTPWDHSLVDSSPRPIAASHVLHRLLVPRHSPFALDNLTTKMLASTVQFSTNDQPTTHNPTPATPPPPHSRNRIRYARPGRAWKTHRGTRLKQASETTTPQSCSFRTQQGAHRPPPAAPTRPFPPPRRAAVLDHHGRCQEKTNQCLRHLSTPTRHTRTAGSIPAFAGWCSLERR